MIGRCRPALPLVALALAGWATPAHADGVLYTTQESVTVRTRDPFFHQGPRVRVGISQGFQFGHGSFHHGSGFRSSGHHRSGVGVGVGFQTAPRYDRFDLERDLESEARNQARRAVTRLKQRLRSVSGVVVESSVEAGSARSEGFDLVATARARVVFLTPEPLAETHPLAASSSRAKTTVDLRLTMGGQALPVTAHEVARLFDDPQAERETLLGGLLRHTWRTAMGADAGGTKGEIDLEAVAGGQLVGRFAMPSLDATLGRPKWIKRVFGAENQTPSLDADMAQALTSAQLRAEQLDRAGRPRAKQLLERLRSTEQGKIGERERDVILRLGGE